MIGLAPILALLGKRSTWITLLVVVGVLLAGFAVMNYVSVKSENMAIKTELSQEQAKVKQYQANIKANEKALTTRNELISALATTETVERVKTVKALEANPDWSKQPIPADVLASLRD
jgi:ABC-type maltose transport system permease subunit